MPLRTRGRSLRVRPLDLVIILASAAAFVASALGVYGNAGPSSLVVSGEAGEWLYPLSVDRTVSVPGPLGETVIRIEDGGARIVDSPCANKTCVAAQAIRKPGDWTACLPNGVFMRVDGSEEGDDAVDATVR